MSIRRSDVNERIVKRISNKAVDFFLQVETSELLMEDYATYDLI